MIWTNMSLPSVNYRVQLCDTWAELDFERMDNPKEGDKIVYRSLGEDNVPYISKTEVYSGGEWTEESGGGAVSLTVNAVVASYGMTPEDFSEAFPNVFAAMYDFNFPVQSNVIVSIDGTEYECELQGNGDDEPYYYGGTLTLHGDDPPTIDFSVYPFSLVLMGNWAYCVPEVPSALTVVDVIVKDTYDSIQPERTTIETGTAVEDEGDPGTYIALLPDVGDASELADCYITIGGKTYKIIDDEGFICFAMGSFKTTMIATGLSAFVGGDFEIFKVDYELDNDLSWNDISYNSGSSSFNGANVYVQTSGTVIDDNGVATQSLISVGMAAVPIKTAVDDIIVVKAEKSGLATGVQWSGSVTATNCTATLLAKTDNAATIYRFIKVTNVSGGASIQNVATAYTT